MIPSAFPPTSLWKWKLSDRSSLNFLLPCREKKNLPWPPSIPGPVVPMEEVSPFQVRPTPMLLISSHLPFHKSQPISSPLSSYFVDLPVLTPSHSTWKQSFVPFYKNKTTLLWAPITPSNGKHRFLLPSCSHTYVYFLISFSLLQPIALFQLLLMIYWNKIERQVWYVGVKKSHKNHLKGEITFFTKRVVYANVRSWNHKFFSLFRL